MHYNMRCIIGTALFILTLASSGNALKIPSELTAGRIFGASIPKGDYDALVEYATAPRAEMSGHILDIIKRAYPDSAFKKMPPSQHFVIFLAVGGVNQIAYIHKRDYKIVFVTYVKGYTDPRGIHMFARDIFAIWLTDSADDFLTSVEVDITKLTRSMCLTTLESPAPIRKYISDDDGEREIEIGIKHFKMPFLPASVKFSFVRRDLDTFERRTWSGSYRVLRPVTIFGEFNICGGIFVPISDAKLKRYAIESNVIRSKDIKETAFLTAGLDWSARRDIKYFRAFPSFLLPDFFIGIGMPVDLKKINNNSWIVGYSWPISGGLIKLSLALHFPGENELAEGYRVGDTVSDSDAGSVISGRRLKWIMGLSISFASIRNML